MDIKSKKLDKTAKAKLGDKRAARMIAFVLCVLLITTSFISAILCIYKVDKLDYEGSVLDAFSISGPYDASDQFSEIYNQAARDVAEYFIIYRNTNNNEMNYEGEIEYYDYDGVVENLEKNYGIKYYVSDGNVHISNIPLNDEGYPADTDIALMPSNMDNYIVSDIFIGYDDVVMYFALGDEFIKNQDSALSKIKDTVIPHVVIICISLFLSLILFIWLLVVSGRKRSDGTRALSKIDAIPIEISFVIIILISLVPTSLLGRDIFYFIIGNRINTIGIIFISLWSIIFSTIVLWVILSIVKNIKAGLLIKRSIIYLVCKNMGHVFKSMFDKRNPLAKSIIMIVLLFFAATINGILFAVSFLRNDVWFLFFVIGIGIFVLVILYTYRLAKKYVALRKGIDEIVAGNTAYKIPVKNEESTSEFDEISLNVNKIGSAIDVAVKSEMKKEMLKSELISNVSHDLKTPLTSIISYTDLLKKEGLRSKNASEYLRIIDEKSQRLKVLTEDLFSAAKAASGDIAVKKEKVDLLALLNQEIAEICDEHEEINLDIRVNAEEDNYYVLADSQLLWRVVDNLMNNVRKYALPGSRVYIDIEDSVMNMTTIVIKNISAIQLNIPADELMTF